jgi:hypothetical protein
VFGPGEVCDFGVVVDPINGKQRETAWPPEPDGTVHTRVAGRWKIRITNADSGASLVRNATGPGDFWTFPDGTGRSINRGHTLAWLLPEEGGPELWLQSGRIVWSIDENFLFTVVKMTGRSEDLCAALG